MSRFVGCKKNHHGSHLIGVQKGIALRILPGIVVARDTAEVFDATFSVRHGLRVVWSLTSDLGVV